MKRAELLRHLREHGCVFIREGGSHSWWAIQSRTIAPRLLATPKSMTTLPAKYATTLVSPLRGENADRHFASGIGFSTRDDGLNVMKRILLTGLLCGWSLAAGAAPRLTCAEPVHDFGVRADERELVRHAFVLRNEGTETLQIGEVKTTCGCTVARLASSALPPGGTTELAVTLNLTGRRGAQRKDIRVASNDPRQPELILTLQGAVEPDQQFVPATALFDHAPDAESPARTILLKTRRPARLVAARAGAEWVEVRAPTNATGTEFALEVAARAAAAEAGGRNSQVWVELDPAPAQPLALPVYWYVPEDIVIAPRDLVVPPRGAPGTRHLILRPGRIRAFQVRAVRAPDGIKTEVAPFGDGYRVRLHGDWSATAPDAQVIIETDAGGGREFAVPVRRMPVP